MSHKPVLSTLIMALLFLRSVSGHAAESTGDQLVQQGNAAFKRGQREEAISLFGRAIVASPTNVVAYYNRGRVLAQEGRHEEALPDYDQVLKVEPQRALAWHLRGVSHFTLGHITNSISDFNHYLELAPNHERYYWQRGIALYYGGRYEEGRRQFELCHTLQSNDVENAVWHFLCVARSSGLEKARASLLPISSDPRGLPMLQIHALFASKAQPEDVIAAAKAATAKGSEPTPRLFYANLYLGLYDEAKGDVAGTREHIAKAAEEAPRNNFMGDVARLHAKLLRQAAEAQGKP